MMEMQCVITGKVQNVAYRAYAQEAADQLGITGWIKNAADGSVLVCAQGEPEVLKAFVEYLHEGSLLSIVEGVDVTWGAPKNQLTDFSILYV